MSMLSMIKVIHTAIWLFFNAVMAYLFYAVAVNRIDRWVWVCLSLFAIEGLVLSAFKCQCPLTILARRYSNSVRDNFDIFLPNWLENYKVIYTTLLVMILIIRIIAK